LPQTKNSVQYNYRVPAYPGKYDQLNQNQRIIALKLYKLQMSKSIHRKVSATAKLLKLNHLRIKWQVKTVTNKVHYKSIQLQIHDNLFAQATYTGKRKSSFWREQ